MYPRLLIVPVNTSVSLTCEVQYNGSYSVQWYRNTESQSFYENPSEANNSTLPLNITVESDHEIVYIQCIIHPINGKLENTIPSNYATLNAISEGNRLNFNVKVLTFMYYKINLLFLVGIAPNPLVEPLLNAESRGFHLKWSPPFLWTAFPIHYCLVSIIHTNHSNSVHYGNNIINITAESSATFNESGIMSLKESINNPQSPTCTEMTFVIMAFNSKGEVHNKPVSVTGRYPSGLYHNNCTIIWHYQ